ncbi:hypothetical protein ColKHC_11538 [Colletotrichum higginsianum]|nr:hypothetical protein ColKHC_11538 [Colletotrichum higginsianum]
MGGDEEMKHTLNHDPSEVVRQLTAAQMSAVVEQYGGKSLYSVVAVDARMDDHTVIAGFTPNSGLIIRTRQVLRQRLCFFVGRMAQQQEDISRIATIKQHPGWLQAVICAIQWVRYN